MAPKSGTVSDLTEDDVIRQALAGAGNHDDVDISRAGMLGWERAEELLKHLDRRHFVTRPKADPMG